MVELNAKKEKWKLCTGNIKISKSEGEKYSKGKKC